MRMHAGKTIVDVKFDKLRYPSGNVQIVGRDPRLPHGPSRPRRNMRQKNVRTMERSWRKKSKRGVSPIIATILLVAITVVLAAVLYILISGLTKGPGNTPIGTALALGSPAEASNAAANHWYNFSVQSAGGGLTLGSLAFQVQTSSGGIVTLPGGAAITVLGLTGNTVGTYNIASGSWASGGTTRS